MPWPPWMTSLPVLALEVIVAADIRHDVVAGAAEDDVVAVAALEPVVAAVAIERVVAFAGDEDVIEIGAAQHDMLVAGVLEIIRVGARCRRVVPNHLRLELVATEQDPRLGVADVVEALIDVGRGGIVTQNAVRTGIVEYVGVELPRRVDLEDEARGREHVARQVRGVGVRHDQFGERVVLQLVDEVETRKAGEVVKPVTVLEASPSGLRTRS